MRTNIVIDDQLMEAAMKAGGFKTKKDAVEEGLRLLARRAAYQNLRALRGKLQWDESGDWTLPAAPTVVPGALTTMPSAWASSGCQNSALARINASPRLGRPKNASRRFRAAEGWRARKANWRTSIVRLSCSGALNYRKKSMRK